MPFYRTEDTVKCTFSLSPHTLQLLSQLAVKLTKDTGGCFQVTRTEVIEMAVRHLAQKKGINGRKLY